MIGLKGISHLAALIIAISLASNDAEGQSVPWRCADARLTVSLISADVMGGTQMAFARDGALWVIELRGRLLRLVETPQGVESKVVYEFGHRAFSTDSQMGATSLALPPEFDGRSGTIFVAHNWDESDGRFGGVSRITMERGDVAAVTLVFGPIASGGAHQVDRLAFDDKGMLLTIGDAWRPHLAQIDEDPHGKVIHFDRSDLLQKTEDAPYRMLAKGLRNPFALARRKSDGLVIVGDNGAGVNDALFIVKRDADFGWGGSKNQRKDPLFLWRSTVSPDGLCFYERPRLSKDTRTFPEEYEGNLFAVLFGPVQHAATSPLEKVRQVVRFELARKTNAIERASTFLEYVGSKQECPLDLVVGPQGDLYLLTFDVGTESGGTGKIYRISAR